METKRKNVVALASGQTLEQVDELYLAGMRVALLDGSCSANELARLCELVKKTFYTHNDPIGLMLRLTPDMEDAPLSLYQYVLLEGFAPTAAQQWRGSHPDFTGLVLVQASGEDAFAFADGIFTADPQIAEKARDLGLLVLTDDISIPSDGVLYHAGTPAEEIAARQETLAWDEEYILSRMQQAAPDKLYGSMAALNAMKSDAKAILVLTTDGSNLSEISSLYPPIPIIAIAKRPEREAMLLCQTMRWSTLPTAITRTPESMDVESFARFVAQLYGYQKGDHFVAMGHWVEGQNQNQLCCFTL